MMQGIADSGTHGPLVFTTSDSTANTWLAAALAAIGIEPHPDRPLTAVCGPGISTLRVTWYFAPQSVCGKYLTSAMIKAWEDPRFHLAQPEHPLAYLKTGFENHARLVDLIKQNIPLAMVRRGNKIAFLRTDAPDSTQRKIFKLL